MRKGFLYLCKLILLMILIIPELSLILINTFGYYRLQTIPPPNITGEIFEKLPVYSTDDLIKYADVSLERDGAGATAYKIYDTVTRRFYHKRANYELSTDWAMWLVGKFAGQQIDVHNTNLILRSYWNAECGQQAFVMADTCARAGLQARYYCFEGHAVCEVFIDGKWRMYDPDCEFYLDIPASELHNYPDLITSLYASTQNGTVDNYYDVIMSSEDDYKAASSAIGRYWYQVPEIRWFKWGVPIVGILIYFLFNFIFIIKNWLKEISCRN